MRIIAGQAKGRVLRTREGRKTRPTDARAREMLFNILRERVVGARVLDLYAGSGAVGLEALSRGASFCLFIEQNAAAASAIRANIHACGYGEQSQVWQTSVRSALRRLSEEPRPFDLIFADPPFTNPQELTLLCKQLARALDNAPQMLHNAQMTYGVAHNLADVSADGMETSAADAAAGGLLVVQHHRKERPQLPENWGLWQERRAGESILSFFRAAHKTSDNLNKT